MLLKQWIEKSHIMGFGGIPIMSGKDSEFLVRLKNVEYDQSIKLIAKAIELGVTFFDTALDYGDSEEKIGKATKNCRDRVILATKSKALTYDEMMYSVEKSLKNLSTDYIDLYQLHFVKDSNSYNTIMGDNGAYKALEKLKDQKVCLNTAINYLFSNIYIKNICKSDIFLFCVKKIAKIRRTYNEFRLFDFL